MKRIFSFLALAAAFAACKKDSVSSTPLASLNIVNAAVNVPSIKSNFVPDAAKPNYYKLITASTAYGANTPYGVLANTNYPLYIINSADSTKTIATASINYGSGEIYTLYLAGSSTQVDTILRKEAIPSFTDSSCGVRFINLSYNSSPIKITLSATPTVDELGTSLAYKQQSGFKTYPATVANNTYAFQVRDAGTNNLLGSYTLTVPRFFSCTLAWIGQTGTTGGTAPKVQRINNY